MPFFRSIGLILLNKFLKQVAFRGAGGGETAARRQILPGHLRSINHKRAKLQLPPGPDGPSAGLGQIT